MEDLYFKNEEAKIIFALVELPGKIQMDLLGMFPSPIGVIFSLILYSKKLLFAIVYRAIIVWLFKF